MARGWIILAMALALGGCVGRAPRKALPPPPAAVSTVRLAAALATNQGKTASAQTRIVRITETVEKIVKETDPATAEKLTAVNSELLRVSADLRDAQDAAALAERECAAEQTRADALRDWGVGQQAEAAANGEGWREEAAAHGVTKISNNRRGNWLGWLGAAALGFAATHFIRAAVPWTWALPPVVALGGYFLTRSLL